MARAKPLQILAPNSAPDSRAVVAGQQSNELFFAVVGPVGAGGSRVISSLKRVCENAGYDCEWIKASALISEWAVGHGQELPQGERKTLENVIRFQDLGDLMRESDSTEVAKSVVREIAKRRAAKTGQPYVQGEAVLPDGSKRAYLIDSIRHPSEIYLLRRAYGAAFALIGVVCEEDARKSRILAKYFTGPEQMHAVVKKRVDDFIQRDSDDPAKKHGQHVSDSFFEADFFIDNTASDPDDGRQLLDDDLSRLVSIIAHDRIVRPTIEETAIHHAYSARVRSACLSRQVGAALVDADGTVVATGTNEAPSPGGGVYGERFHLDPLRATDHRCAFESASPYCSNNREQNAIIDELIAMLPELSTVSDKKGLQDRIRKTRLGGLIEFSRAVHAEMDAILSAGRDGASTVGTRLFVTTFPCHYCAWHIVSAGIYEVQYIEPYPKSLALKLHKDAIEVDLSKWIAPAGRDPAFDRSKRRDEESPAAGKVLFHPFVGVAPRMYARAYEKTWQLKNKVTGELEIKAPEWGSEWASLKVGYPELEALLAG